MTRLSRHHLMLLFAVSVSTAVSTALLPMLGAPWLLFADMAVRGGVLAAYHTGEERKLDVLLHPPPIRTSWAPGSNVICVENWRGRNGGPHMHLMHLCYSLGSLIAPLLVKPFLGDYYGRDSTANTTGSTRDSIANNSDVGAGGAFQVEDQHLPTNDTISAQGSGIKLLYVICGLLMFLVSVAFLVVGLRYVKTRVLSFLAQRNLT